MRKGREELAQEGPKTGEDDWANLLKTAADEIGECSYEPPEEVCAAARQALDSGMGINDVLSFYKLTPEDVLTARELWIHHEMNAEAYGDCYSEAES